MRWSATITTTPLGACSGCAAPPGPCLPAALSPVPFLQGTCTKHRERSHPSELSLYVAVTGGFHTHARHRLLICPRAWRGACKRTLLLRTSCEISDRLFDTCALHALPQTICSVWAVRAAHAAPPLELFGGAPRACTFWLFRRLSTIPYQLIRPRAMPYSIPITRDAGYCSRAQVCRAFCLIAPEPTP